MTIKKTIGGDRIGSGKKMTVDLKTYNRSTHDLGYVWRSTMSAGTLVPFIKELTLPGDTFDIDLDIDIKTHPTIGPLFGSYKVQLDVYTVPIRLYQSALHNNAIGIGMKMQDIKLPQLALPCVTSEKPTLTELDYEQLANDPSSLLSHLDIIGGGIKTEENTVRLFNAIPYLGYWDIYKNYYANKQEEIGAFINIEKTKSIAILGAWGGGTESGEIPQTPPPDQSANKHLTEIEQIAITFETTPTTAQGEEILIFMHDENTQQGVTLTLTDLFSTIAVSGNNLLGQNLKTEYQTETTIIVDTFYNKGTEINEIQISQFPLENVDETREKILAKGKYEQVIISNGSSFPSPYVEQVTQIGNLTRSNYSQQGLALKTYQSDLFNNWMSTEWIDNASTGINAITAIDTSEGSFTLDTLNLANKVYDMLNRIAISGGTYQDWVETVYTHDYINRSEIPVYQGGLSTELVFEEVVSVSETNDQPLGTLAGKGRMSNNKKGGKVIIKTDEPSYIIGIASLTPRVDYSQGNKWDTQLKTMDDLHKPALDEIGYQDLITDQMAWWTTEIGTNGEETYKSAGKQPAWINYMTNVNKAKGNFAKIENEMFMTLNRRYEGTNGDITDMTTYIDPSKFNFIFAETKLDAQNFWAQIAVNITARRKMSAKIMPNL